MLIEKCLKDCYCIYSINKRVSNRLSNCSAEAYFWVCDKKKPNKRRTMVNCICQLLELCVSNYSRSKSAEIFRGQFVLLENNCKALSCQYCQNILLFP